MSKADLDVKLNILKNISTGELKAPSNIPVAVYLREAEKLVEVGRRDWNGLQSIGFLEELLVDLPVRIGALREAESLWRSCRSGGSGARQAWKEGRRRGDKLRDHLRITFRFAYRKDKNLVDIVRDLGKGRAHHAMIQALNNLALLGRENRAPLEAIKFDLMQLDEAADLAKRLGKMLGQVDYERYRAQDTRLLRDAAFTHLQEGLKELREFALYLFGDDREKMLDYTSDYLRNKRLKRKMAVGKVEDRDAWHRGFTEAGKYCVAKAFNRTPKELREPIAGRGSRRKCKEKSITAMNRPGMRTETSGVRTGTSGVRTETSGVRTETPEMRTETSGARTDAINECSGLFKSTLSSAGRCRKGLGGGFIGLENALTALAKGLQEKSGMPGTWINGLPGTAKEVSAR